MLPVLVKMIDFVAGILYGTEMETSLSMIRAPILQVFVNVFGECVQYKRKTMLDEAVFDT